MRVTFGTGIVATIWCRRCLNLAVLAVTFHLPSIITDTRIILISFVIMMLKGQSHRTGCWFQLIYSNFWAVLGRLPLHQMAFLPIKLVQPCLYGHCIVHWFALVCTASTTPFTQQMLGCSPNPPSCVGAVFLPGMF